MEEKIFCGRCKREREVSFFNTNKRKRGYQSWCKECIKEYDKERFQLNKEKRRIQRNERRSLIRKWFAEYKENLKCKECGFSHPASLDFHHRDLKTKTKNVSDMVRNHSIESIKKEIEKCDVLCANCHRILHYDINNLIEQ